MCIKTIKLDSPVFFALSMALKIYSLRRRRKRKRWRLLNIVSRIWPMKHHQREQMKINKIGWKSMKVNILGRDSGEEITGSKFAWTQAQTWYLSQASQAALVQNYQNSGKISLCECTFGKVHACIILFLVIFSHVDDRMIKY